MGSGLGMGSDGGNRGPAMIIPENKRDWKFYSVKPPPPMPPMPQDHATAQRQARLNDLQDEDGFVWWIMPAAGICLVSWYLAIRFLIRRFLGW